MGWREIKGNLSPTFLHNSIIHMHPTLSTSITASPHTHSSYPDSGPLPSWPFAGIGWTRCQIVVGMTSRDDQKELHLLRPYNFATVPNTRGHHIPILALHFTCIFD